MKHNRQSHMDTSKKAILCPNCRRLINRFEKRCAHCGIRHPGAWWKNHPIVSGIADPNQCVTWIITVNIIMFAASILLSADRIGFSHNPLNFLSPSHQSLLLLGSSGTVPFFQLHHWWSLISANYLHGSLLHILFNMLALRQLAPIVLQEYGFHRMFIIYTLGGAAGYLLSSFAGVNFTIGASAAVCSLIGAILFFAKSLGGDFGRHLYSQVSGWAMSIFIFGFLVPGINNWGHGGGMAAGALFGYLLQYNVKRRETLGHKLFSSLCIILTIIILSWSFLRTTLFTLQQ